MRVNGEWLICQDGTIRPTLTGMVRIAGGKMIEVPFLLDAGADRTVLSARFLHRLQPLKTAADDQIQLAGVGGRVGSITVDTVIGFTRDDGRTVTVRAHTLSLPKARAPSYQCLVAT